MAETKRFLLRLDPRLFEAIRRWADDDLRSINAQIEYLLTERARRAGRLPQRRDTPELREPTDVDDDDGARTAAPVDLATPGAAVGVRRGQP